MDILSIGEILIDLTQTGVNAKGVPLYAANPGGAPANLSVAAARLGARTAFIGKVGDDAFGRYLTDVLKKDSRSEICISSIYDDWKEKENCRD